MKMTHNMTPEEFERFAEKIKPLLDRYTDKLGDTTFSLWNALLTVQGIFMGAFAILAATGKMGRILSLGLMGCSFLSTLFLVYNIVTLRRMYNEILKKLQTKIQEQLGYDEDEFAHRKTEASWRYRFELAAQILLLVESVALLVFVYCTT